MSTLEQGDYAVAYETVKRVLLTLITAHSRLHPQLMTCVDLMTAIVTGLNDFDRAVELSRAALYCAEVIYGKDSLETAKRHTQLASILYKNEMVYEALAHNTLAHLIYCNVNGADSEYVKAMYLNMGMCAMQCGYIKEALEYMELSKANNDVKSDAYLNAAFYAVVLNA